MATTHTIEAALARAADRWPRLQVDARAFEAHLVKLPVSDSALTAHGSDLALAFACLAGTPVAIDEIDLELRQQGAVARRRFDLDDHGLSEVLQIIRTRLLTGPQPRIGKYAGSGPMGAWLRMIVIREAFDHLRRNAKDEDLPLEQAASEALSPDEAVDRIRHVPRLREALESALAALSAEDRTLLKLHFLDGVTLDRLAALMRVHRATIARRIATLRRQILTDVASRLGVRFGTRPSEMRSLWRTFGAQVQITLSRILAP